jgi:hypothetical protein
MPHYRAGDGSLDSAVTDGFDASRPVILFDNAGVAGSSGEIPNMIEPLLSMPPILSVSGLSTVDVFGCRRVYPAITRAHQPEMVRYLILSSTGPRGGEISTDPGSEKKTWLLG